MLYRNLRKIWNTYYVHAMIAIENATKQREPHLKAIVTTCITSRDAQLGPGSHRVQSSLDRVRRVVHWYSVVQDWRGMVVAWRRDVRGTAAAVGRR